MPLRFDTACQNAVDLAKRAVPDGAKLDVEQLTPALLHATDLRARLPRLAALVPPPETLRTAPPGSLAVSPALHPVFRRLMLRDHAITADELFLALMDSPAGRDFVRRLGASDEEMEAAAAVLEPRSPEPGWRSGSALPAGTPGWRRSPDRARVIEALNPFGRLLTATEIPDRTVVGREKELRAVIEILHQMGRRNAIVLGFPGTGKSALVFELARRVLRGHASIPERMRDLDVFELSPVFLRSGASVVGQYEERVKTLLALLRAQPKIILFVDEIHALFQSGIHDRGPFSDANEAFKVALGRNEITCIGTSSPAEYRRFIEPDRALVRRFGLVRLDPPTRETTIDIVAARLPRMERHYAPLAIPTAMIERAVDLSDEHLPALYQPDKAIQLLDAACAASAIAQPPPPAVTEDAVLEALADFLGHEVATSVSLTEDKVFAALAETILGQEPALCGIARAFTAGLDRRWRETGDRKPRGVFLFGGPTGTGKTAAAVALSRLLGGGRESLIRIDGNALQGSGFDSGPAQNRLLGVPPGYVGYVPGQGGLLSRIRDNPECVVLFDEFEKADPGVGEILLRILDEGRTEDVEGHLLDFRQAFIVFTTNAGTRHPAAQIAGLAKSMKPRHEVRAEDVWRDLRDHGLGPEFESRVHGVYMFRPLDRERLREIATRFLAHIAGTAAGLGLTLTWDDAVPDRLVEASDIRLGARNVKAIVHSRVFVELKVAQAAGELEGVRRIRVRVAEVAPATSAVVRSRRDDALEIVLG